MTVESASYTKRTVKILAISVVCLVVTLALLAVAFILRANDLDRLSRQRAAANQQVIAEILRSTQEDAFLRQAPCPLLKVLQTGRPEVKQAAAEFAHRLGCPP